MTLDCESLQFPAANATSESQAELNPAQLCPKGLAISNIARTAGPRAVQRYLGTLNFLARFCPKLSDVVEPLREKTHKDITFQWSDSHDKAFVESKELVANAPVLFYFNTQLPVSQYKEIINHYRVSSSAHGPWLAKISSC